MLDAAGFGNESADVNDGWQNVGDARRANGFDIVDAVLQADDKGVGSEKRCERFGGGRVVDGLDAEKDDFDAAGRAEIGGRFDADGFLKRERVEEQAVLLDSVDESGATDEDDGSTGASEHAAEVAPDGSSPNDGDFGPGRGTAHAVIT